MGSRPGASFLLPSPPSAGKPHGAGPFPLVPPALYRSLLSRLEPAVTLELRGWGAAAAESGVLSGAVRVPALSSTAASGRDEPCVRRPGQAGKRAVCPHLRLPSVSTQAAGVCWALPSVGHSDAALPPSFGPGGKHPTGSKDAPQCSSSRGGCRVGTSQQCCP